MRGARVRVEPDRKPDEQVLVSLFTESLVALQGHRPLTDQTSGHGVQMELPEKRTQLSEPNGHRCSISWSPGDGLGRRPQGRGGAVGGVRQRMPEFEGDGFGNKSMSNTEHSR